jgi:hypothetical protein
MEITSQQNVQIRFTVREGDHEYTDALYFTPEEFAALTEEQLEAMKVRRFENWKAIVTTPRPEPTEEEKAAQLEALKAEQERIAAQIAGLEPQMLSMDEAQASGAFVVKG